jgi:cytochrome c oxidase accessory protein FixG
MQPTLSTGRLWHRRRIVGIVLIVIFVALPHLRFGGKPVVLLDVPARQFIIMGHTFLPTDTLLLALGMISVFLSIVLATAIGGRLWCGWGCPQTVYMEFLFRPIDRLFEGTVGKGGKPKRQLSGAMRVLRWGIYLVLSMFLAHTFLSYFVGTERLAMWIRSSPWQHPAAFLVMTGTTVAMLFDFLFFREQLCLIACPYGRFQSVMLDARSRIVGYDFNRGEPRRKGKLVRHSALAAPDTAPPEKSTTAGDCVDCNRCVAVCPTGIDIRDGLQMECINCTQCIDACDDVMTKVGLPTGLIRYTSQDELAGKPSRLLRARTIVYPLALAVAVIGFLFVLSGKYAFDARILRAAGSPFSINANGNVRNNMRLRLVNRDDRPQSYTVDSVSPGDMQVTVIDRDSLNLQVGESSLIPIAIEFPVSATGTSGRTPAKLKIVDASGHVRELDFNLLGPRR